MNINNTKLEKELQKYSKTNAYEAIHFKTAICDGGNKEFFLDVDDLKGVAIRTCDSCMKKEYMLDSLQYAEEDKEDEEKPEEYEEV